MVTAANESRDGLNRVLLDIGGFICDLVARYPQMICKPATQKKTNASLKKAFVNFIILYSFDRNLVFFNIKVKEYIHVIYRTFYELRDRYLFSYNSLMTIINEATIA